MDFAPRETCINCPKKDCFLRKSNSSTPFFSSDNGSSERYTFYETTEIGPYTLQIWTVSKSKSSPLSIHQGYVQQGHHEQQHVQQHERVPGQHEQQGNGHVQQHVQHGYVQQHGHVQQHGRVPGHAQHQTYQSSPSTYLMNFPQTKWHIDFYCNGVIVDPKLDPVLSNFGWVGKKPWINTTFNRQAFCSIMQDIIARVDPQGDFCPAEFLVKKLKQTSVDISKDPR